MLRWSWIALTVGCASSPSQPIAGTWQGEGRLHTRADFVAMALQVEAVDRDTILITSEALGLEGAVLTYVAPEDWLWGVATHGFISTEGGDEADTEALEEGAEPAPHLPELRLSLYDHPACAHGNLAVGAGGSFAGQRVGGDRPRYCEVPELGDASSDGDAPPAEAPEDTDAPDDGDDTDAAASAG